MQTKEPRSGLARLRLRLAAIVGAWRRPPPDERTETLARFLREVYPGLADPGPAVREPEGYHVAGFREAARHHGLAFRTVETARYEFLRDGTVIGRLHGMLTDLVGPEVVKLCADKQRTSALLRQAGVPAPRHRAFRRDRVEPALAFAARRGFAVVVKPCRGVGGKGISTAITGAEDLRRAWRHAESALPPGRAERILVEARCPGMDIRAVVVGGRFVCAATRLPAHVIGDGRSMIAELVAEKNERKGRHPYHGRYPILIDERAAARLRALGKSDRTVPPAGDVVVLAEVNNIHAGGESCDITDRLAPRIRSIAERAAQAIPGLAVVGVDLLVTSFDDDAEVAVIEMNPRANLSVHYAPFRGTPRNPADEIVRLMLERADGGAFPAT